MNYDESDKRQNKKLILQAFAVITVIIIIVILSIVTRLTKPADTEAPLSETAKADQSTYEVEDSSYPQLIFENSGFITEALPNSLGWQAMDILERDIILSDGEISSATEANSIELYKDAYIESLDGIEISDDDYVATLDGASLVEDYYVPYLIYSMQFNISDDRIYQVSLITYDGTYCGVIAQRIAPSIGQTYLYIIIPNHTNYVYPDRDTVIKDMIKFAKDTYGGEVIVTTSENAWEKSEQNL